MLFATSRLLLASLDPAGVPWQVRWKRARSRNNITFETDLALFRKFISNPDSHS